MKDPAGRKTVMTNKPARLVQRSHRRVAGALRLFGAACGLIVLGQPAVQASAIESTTNVSEISGAGANVASVVAIPVGATSIGTDEDAALAPLFAEVETAPNGASAGPGASFVATATENGTDPAGHGPIFAERLPESRADTAASAMAGKSSSVSENATAFGNFLVDAEAIATGAGATAMNPVLIDVGVIEAHDSTNVAGRKRVNRASTATLAAAAESKRIDPATLTTTARPTTGVRNSAHLSGAATARVRFDNIATPDSTAAPAGTVTPGSDGLQPAVTAFTMSRQLSPQSVTTAMVRAPAQPMQAQRPSALITAAPWFLVLMLALGLVPALRVPAAIWQKIRTAFAREPAPASPAPVRAITPGMLSANVAPTLSVVS